MAVLEDEDEGAEGAADRQEVEKDGLQRNEQRAEGEEEDDEGRGHDQGDDQPHPPADRVLVVGVEGGEAAHAETGSREARSARRDRPAAARARRRPRPRGRCPRAGRPRGGRARPPSRGRSAWRSPGGAPRRRGRPRGRRDRRAATAPAPRGGSASQPLAEAALRFPALALERGRRLGQLDHDAQGLDHSPAPHRAQVRDPPGRLDRRRQPVAARDARVEARRLRGQEQQGQARHEQDRPRAGRTPAGSRRASGPRRRPAGRASDRARGGRPARRGPRAGASPPRGPRPG